MNKNLNKAISSSGTNSLNFSFSNNFSKEILSCVPFSFMSIVCAPLYLENSLNIPSNFKTKESIDKI